jgi:hypothetical protein
MGRKDKRPESRPDRNTADEKSRKANDLEGFADETGEGQTGGQFERGSEPGQYTDAGSPGQTRR